MKIAYSIVMTICFFLGTQNVQSQKYKLDIKNSTLSWTGKAAFNSYSLTGTLKTKEGNISINEIEITNLNVIIDMKSLDHENENLKNHLKNEDFFEVKTYPKVSFQMYTSVSIESEKTVLIGSLTIKDQTKVEKIPVIIEKTDLGITLKFNHIIDRTKYGVNHNSPSIFKRMKENAIADEFILKGKLKFDSD